MMNGYCELQKEPHYLSDLYYFLDPFEKKKVPLIQGLINTVGEWITCSIILLLFTESFEYIIGHETLGYHFLTTSRIRAKTRVTEGLGPHFKDSHQQSIFPFFPNCYI